MSESRVLNSACRCGRVRFVAAGEPLATVRCYCRSCRTASTALSQLPGAASVAHVDGGTEYTLFRKDRVTCSSGTELLAEHRLKVESPTRRVIATCCNTPVFLDFTRGHWFSLYRQSIDPLQRPAVAVGVMARHRDSPPEAGSTLPSHPAFPPRLFARLMFAWVAMGFRRPVIKYGTRRLQP